VEDFIIRIVHFTKTYRLLVKRKVTTSSFERFEVKAANHSFLYGCDRPLFIANGIYYLPWNWTLIESTCESKWLIEEIRIQLEIALRQKYDEGSDGSIVRM